MARYRDTIIGGVRRAIEGERAQMRREAERVAVEPEVTLGPVEYRISFVKNCKGAVVMADYVWHIKGPQMHPVSKPRRRTFGCAKVFGAWVCS